MRTHNPGEIKQGRKVSPIVHAINNYVGQAKYEAAHLKDGVVPSGKYVYPVIGALALGGYGLLSAPVSTTVGGIGGWTGGRAADFGTKLATGKPWAEWVSDKTGLVPEAAEMTKVSKMKSEIVEPTFMRGFDGISETPLSSSSMSELLSRGTSSKRPWELRYANGYMTHFNSQGLHPQLHPNNFLFEPLLQRLILATDFVNKFPGARKPFIGLDGKLKISIPLNKKIIAVR